MANTSKNDSALLRNLVKSGMVKPVSLPKSPQQSREAAIKSRQKELRHDTSN